jgi:hypothetical protein
MDSIRVVVSWFVLQGTGASTDVLSGCYSSRATELLSSRSKLTAAVAFLFASPAHFDATAYPSLLLDEKAGTNLLKFQDSRQTALKSSTVDVEGRSNSRPVIHIIIVAAFNQSFSAAMHERMFDRLIGS